MPSDPLEQLLATAHATFCCLDDLRQTNQSITYMKGVVTGVFATLTTLGLIWLAWRIL